MILLYNCSSRDSLSGWQVVNDGVMGGRSYGRIFRDQDGNCIFSGRISLENNGGFSMVRLRQDIGRLADHFNRFQLRIKGDGRQYQFRVKSTPGQRHSYGIYFDTTGDWQEVTIPFSKMIPIFRGNQLDLPEYEGQQLQEVAFLTGKVAGDFRFQIDTLMVS